MADEELKYVTLRMANFNMNYAGKNGHKSQKGDVLQVPADVAERWQQIGLARPAKAEEVKDFKEWLEGRFVDAYDPDEEDEAPPIYGTQAQREAQANVAIRNRPAPVRPTPAQIGNTPEKDEPDK